MRFLKPLSLALIMILGVLYFGGQSHEVIKDAFPDIAFFVKVKGDYEQLCRQFYPYRCSFEAKSILSEPATYDVSKFYSDQEVDRLLISYMFYPITHNEKDWDYYLDVDGSMTNPDPAWKVSPLSEGGKIYAKPPHDFSSNQVQGKNVFFPAAIFFLAISAFISLEGWTVIRALNISYRGIGKFCFWSLAYLAGLVIFSYVLWLLMIFKIPLARSTVVVSWGITFLLSLFFSRSVKSNPLKEPDLPAENPVGWTGRIFVLLGVLVVVIITLKIIAYPITVWDELSNWMWKSKIFFMHQSFHLEQIDPAGVYYPPLWSIYIASHFTLFGQSYDAFAKWISAATFLALIGQLHGLTRILLPAAARWVVIVMYCLAAYHWTLYSALPESIFVAFLLAMLTSVFLKVRGDDFSGMRQFNGGLAFIMALGLSGLKFEGALIAVFWCILLLVLSKELNFSRRDYLRLAVFPLVLLIPLGWVAWLRAEGKEIFVYHLSQPFLWENVRNVIAIFLAILQFTNVTQLLMFLIFTLVLLKQDTEFSPSEKFIGFMILFWVFFSAASVVRWPPEHILKYYAEVAIRLLLRVCPLVLLFWASRVFPRK